MNELENVLDSLSDDCEIVLTKKQRELLKFKIASYAMAALLDSKVAKEAEEACQDELGKLDYDE